MRDVKFTNFISIVVGTLGKLIISFLGSVLLARNLTTDLLGNYYFILNIIVLISPFANFGLATLAVKKFSGTWINKEIFYSNVLILHCISSFITYLFLTCVGLLLFTDKVQFIYLQVASIGSIFLAYVNVQKYTHEAQLKMKIFQKNIILTAFIGLCMKYITLLSTNNLSLLFFIYTMEILFLTLLMYFHQSNGRKFYLRFIDRRYLEKLICTAFPMTLSSIMVVVYMKVDIFMLGLMTDYHQVSTYVIAAIVSEAWLFVPLAFVSTLYPTIQALYFNKKNAYYQNLRKMMLICLACMVLATLIAIPVINYLIPVIYGSKFTASSAVVNFLICASIFMCLGNIRSRHLTLVRAYKLQFYISFLSAATNIAINLLLIPVLGGEGAAIATLITLLMNFLIFPCIHNEGRRFIYIFIGREFPAVIKNG